MLSGRICKCKHSGLPPDVHAVANHCPIFLQSLLRKPRTNQSWRLSMELRWKTQICFTPTSDIRRRVEPKLCISRAELHDLPDFLFPLLRPTLRQGSPNLRRGRGSSGRSGLAAMPISRPRIAGTKIGSCRLKLCPVSRTSTRIDHRHLLSDIWHNIILFSGRVRLFSSSVVQPDHEQSSQAIESERQPGRAPRLWRSERYDDTFAEPVGGPDPIFPPTRW